MHLVWPKVDERALPGARNSFTGLAGGIAEVEMQRMHAKLATGDHSAAEDGHQQALAVARRQRQIWNPPVSGATRHGGSSLLRSRSKNPI